MGADGVVGTGEGDSSSLDSSANNDPWAALGGAFGPDFYDLSSASGPATPRPGIECSPAPGKRV